MLLLVAAAIASADPAATLFVHATSANVRADAKADAAVLAAIPIATACTALAPPAADVAWLHVHCADVDGYVSAKLVEPTPPSADAERARANDASLPPHDREQAALRTALLTKAPADAALARARFFASSIADLRAARAAKKTSPQPPQDMPCDAVRPCLEQFVSRKMDLDGDDFAAASVDEFGRVTVQMGHATLNAPAHRVTWVVEAESAYDADAGLYFALEEESSPRAHVVGGAFPLADVDAYAKDCAYAAKDHIAVDMVDWHDTDVDFCKALPFYQDCAGDKFGCDTALAKCRVDGCAAPCASCEARCTSTCTDCKARCKGDAACTHACAEDRSRCKNDCRAGLQNCRGTCLATGSKCRSNGEARMKTCGVDRCYEHSHCLSSGKPEECRARVRMPSPECYSVCRDLD